VKIARALSVREGKGDVNASARAGRDRTFWRGNCAAWLSGPEKSRQVKQMSEFGAGRELDCNNGSVCVRVLISGLEERGMGGAIVGSWCLCDETGTGGASGLFSPNDKAERFASSIVLDVEIGAMKRGSTFGIGGMNSVRSCASRVDDGLRDGRRGGRAGTGGLSSVDWMEAKLLSEAVEGGRSDEYFGEVVSTGRGLALGKSASPQAGAFTLEDSLDFVLVAVNLRSSLPPEPEPFPDCEESSEPLLLISCDSFRAGNGGGACEL
jgi:hypothetical protein